MKCIFAALLILTATGAIAAEDITYFSAPTTKAARLPFSDAVRAGDTLYLNNQIGNLPGKGNLVDNSFPAQFEQTMLNIDAVLKANGLSRSNIVMCTVTLTDMANWGELNRLWRASFSADALPARNVIGTTALPLNAAVGVQCIAAYPGASRATN